MTEWYEPTRVAGLLAEWGLPWGFAGGWGVDLFLDRRTRPHKDVDVAVLRRDQLAWQSHLLRGGWELQVAADERLAPWRPGEVLTPPIHGIWCRHASFAPGFLEILLNESAGERFLFRRDTTIQMDLRSAFVPAPSGLPVLAPEVVLLYKAKCADPEPHAADFRNLLPVLGPTRRAWLAAALRRLHGNHPWIRELVSDGGRNGLEADR